MKRYYRSFSKCFSWILIITLSVSQAEGVLYADPLVSQQTSSPSNLFDQIISGISKTNGLVQDFNSASQSSSSPKIIHIQDAHANPSAQQAIKTLIEEITKKYEGPIIVGLEGAQGKVYPEYLNIFPIYPDANKVVIDDLSQKGELGGVELYALANPETLDRKVFIRGIENTFLYQKNLSVYRLLLEKRDDVDRDLQILNQYLESLQSRYFSKELSSFIKERKRRKEGDYSKERGTPQLDAYLLFLRQEARKYLSINLDESIEQLRYPQIFSLIALEKLADNFDAKAAREELGKFESAIASKSLTQSERNTVVSLNNLEVQPDPRRILESASLLAAKYGTDLKSYSNLVQEAGITILRSEINPKALWDEFSAIEESLSGKMCRTDDERKLYYLTENLKTLEKFLYAEMTREDFSKPNSLSVIDPVSWLKQSERLAGRADIKIVSTAKKLHAAFREAKNFYRLAHKRDRVLLNNALRETREIAARSGFRALPLIILVTGGFHTRGLVKSMRGYGIPYAVIQPMIKEIPSPELLQRVYGDDNILTSVNFPQGLTKQQAILLSETIGPAREFLIKKYSLSDAEVLNLTATAVSQNSVLNRDVQLNALIPKSTQDVRENVSTRSASFTDKAIADTALTILPDRYAKLRGKTQGGSRPWGMNSRKSASPFSMRLSARSEVRMKQTEFSKAFKSQASKIINLQGRDRVDFLAAFRDELLATAGGKEALLELLRLELNRNKSALIKDLILEFTRFVQGRKIGIYGFEEGARGTALMLAEAGHDITVLDAPEKLMETHPSPHDFFYRYGQLENYKLIKTVGTEDPIKAGQNPEQIAKREQAFYELVRDNDIIYIDTGLDFGGDYKFYQDHLIGRAMDFGNALARLRNEEKMGGKPFTQKVFITRAMIDEKTTDIIYEKIKWPTQSDDLNYLSFDIVFQPDFIHYEGNRLTEPYVMFGLRSPRETDPIRAQIERRQRAESIEMLKSIYVIGKDKEPRIDFVGLRSAIQAKDDLIVYLSTKLAFFNDLADLSDRFGADLSIVAKGAGLDKRIQTLFSNPSQAFGGRLLVLLKWIMQKRLNQLNGRQVEGRTFTTSDINALLDKKIRDLDKKQGIENVIEDLPKEFRFLFWIKLVLSINERNRTQFLETKIGNYFQTSSLRGKKAALLGVGYSRKSGRVTDSPALELIKRLVIDKNVTDFYIADPQALEDFDQWLVEQRAASRDFDAVRFHGTGKDHRYSIYEAAEASDFTVIAGDSNPDLFHIDLRKLKTSLGDKPLFDGINLFGIRADGELANGTSDYLLENLRDLGINYISVGRPEIGPAFDQSTSHRLTDTRIYSSVSQYPVDEINRIFGDSELSVALTGGGYVGLTTGGLYAELGHRVYVVDMPSSQKKIDGLNSAETIVPIYEPGLREQIVSGKNAEKLSFSTDKTGPIRRSLINILAVGTPQQDDGEIDLTYILDAAAETGEIIRQMRSEGLPDLAPGIPGHFKIMTVKSTVTPDTFDKIIGRLSSLGLVAGKDYALASMPEFLKEGSAVDDVRFPDRTVIGVYSQMPQNVRRFVELTLLKLTLPLMKSHSHPVVVTDTSTATLIKYAANSLLAVSISLANIFAREAEFADADYFEIREALAADPRISKFAFLFPGCGYGGSCFPKDVRALNTLSIAEVSALGVRLIQAADTLNGYFQDEVVDKVIRGLLTRYPDVKEPLRGKSLGIWGITFKPKTDDKRESPLARIVARLLQKGAAKVQIHDVIFNIRPEARTKDEDDFINEIGKIYKKLKLFDPSSGSFKDWFQKNYIDTNRVQFFDDPLKAASSVDGLILGTEWPEYKPLLPELIKNLKVSVKDDYFIMDARNLWKDANSREQIAAAGNISYQGIGTSRILPVAHARSEARLNFGSKSILTTAELTDYIRQVSLAAPDLVTWSPLRSVAENITANALGNLFNRFQTQEEILRFSRWFWNPETNALPVSENKILSLAQTILGPEYFDLLFKMNSLPIHLISAANDNKIPDGALLFLSTAGKDDSLTYVIQGTKQTAEMIEQRFEDRAIRAGGLPITVRSNLNVISSSNANANITAMKREAGSDLRRRIGFVNSQLKVLEKIGYIPNTYRFLSKGLGEDAAISFSALLLKNQLSDPISIKNIRKELEARNLSVDILVERMGRLIEAIRHIATQA